MPRPLNFKREFRQKIIDGEKTSTIRKTCPYKVGDKVNLYNGLRTENCEIISQETITSVQRIKIGRRSKNEDIWIEVSPPEGRKYISATDQGLSEILQTEGFDSYYDMLTFFSRQYFKGEIVWSFDGWLIQWGDPPILQGVKH